ncbi:hypothetical protein F4776DRAFT_674677 [Hypoxylon sp. NC0597]|nr:hypothetical protein F4776DRAFT_674677 [Hypoxylon sp. NC0597]
MVGLRDRFGKYASPSSWANTTFSTDPMVPSSTSDEHGLIDDMGCNRSSLRQRLVQSLNRRGSLSAWHSVVYHTIRDGNQEQRPSVIRKSIRSLSSSLKDRFSSDTSADNETQSRPRSVIRKSFSSMSSSLRGLRTSIDSRLSQDAGGSSRPTRLSRSASTRPSCHNFGCSTDVSSGDDAVPRLPDLEDMVVNKKSEKTSAEVQSPNTLFSMGIFDSLDRPLAADMHAGLDQAPKECNEPTVRQSTPNVVRFPIRVKRPDQAVSKINATLGAPQGSCLRAVSDSGSADCPEQTKDIAKNALETSKEEKRQRPHKKVFVRVPDTDDHSKPWPKNKYPDLRAALTDLCTRFKPYYAPFAAYTSSNRTIQLFPSDFKPPARLFTSDSIMFTLQAALDNWDSTVFSCSLSQDERKEEDSTITERALSTVAESVLDSMPEHSSLHASGLSGRILGAGFDNETLDMDEGFDDDMLDPDPSFIVQHRPFPKPKRTLLNSQLEWSDETLLSEDDDLTIASSLGFYP